MKIGEIKLQRLRPTAIVPQYGTKGSARFDLTSAVDAVIEPNGIALVPIGFAMEIPKGHELQIVSRSGLAAKHGVIVLNAPGIVDEDYRKEVCVLLINHGREPYHIEAGHRIAQAGLAEVIKASFDEVETLNDPKTRHGGFGHTGY